MAYLLDTHTLLWYLENNANLSQRMKAFLEDAENELFLSIASLWEIAIKINIQKLELKTSFEALRKDLEQFQIHVLPISQDDTQELIDLPLQHRDPFDRMIIAQSKNLTLPIISRDKYFSLYDIQVVWF